MNKPGVYICSGCDIGKSLDTDELAKTAKGECKAAACRVHPFLCSPEGIGHIRADLSSGAVDSAVIAACSPRMKTDSFSFEARTVVERVNLREHVTWCQKPKDEDTQMMAEDYLRMGVVKVRKTEPPEPVSEPVSSRILVVGGGVTGISAALEAAAAGYEVTLVEKEARLGGFAVTLKKHFPNAPPYMEPSVNGLRIRSKRRCITRRSRC